MKLQFFAKTAAGLEPIKEGLDVFDKASEARAFRSVNPDIFSQRPLESEVVLINKETGEEV